MSETWLRWEPVLRLTAFVGVLLLMLALEAWYPRRARTRARRRRWIPNLSMSGISTLLVRLIAPAGLTGFALVVEQRGWGLLPALTDASLLRFAIGFAALDLAVYLQHVAFHHVPVLWRLHRVHHTDEDLDATTGVRFHPIEILMSLVIKGSVVALIGAPPLAVLLFEVALSATSLFNHANWRLPLALDAVTRLVVVTPDMHRVHHSTRRDEQDSNFGFNLPWWDRLFRTYRAQPAAPHDTMPLGVQGLPDPGSLPGLIQLPFRGAARPREEVTRGT